MTSPLAVRVEEIRGSLMHGQQATQAVLDAISVEIAPARGEFRPKDKDELLPLFDNDGKNLDRQAPRWVCHILGLRHRCAHILLTWRSPSLGEVLVLQIRSWRKDDSPWCVDISVGGHMTAADPDSEQVALAEMLQETGLTLADLDGPLTYLGGYSFDEARPDEIFYNSEWRDVYVAHVRQDRFGAIRFADGEIAGMVLVPMKDADDLLRQRIMPMASALTHSLPKCLGRQGG
jgi:8-oxo-dGTP pyrophosphatase MutT (NUDIX family)